MKEIERFQLAAKALVEKLPNLLDDRHGYTGRVRNASERRPDAEVVAVTAAAVLAMAERIIQALTPTPIPPAEQHHHTHNHPRPISPLLPDTPAQARTGL